MFLGNQNDTINFYDLKTHWNSDATATPILCESWVTPQLHYLTNVDAVVVTHLSLKAAMLLIIHNFKP